MFDSTRWVVSRSGLEYRSIRSVARDLFNAGLSEESVLEQIERLGQGRGCDVEYVIGEVAKAKKGKAND